MRCTKCGALVSKDGTVCKKCGAPIVRNVEDIDNKAAVQTFQDADKKPYNTDSVATKNDSVNEAEVSAVEVKTGKKAEKKADKPVQAEKKAEPDKEADVSDKEVGARVNKKTFSRSRTDFISPKARENIERHKALAAKRMEKPMTDEEKIAAAVPILKGAMLYNKQGWECRVCGHNNPPSATSCIKCGRDRVRMAKLEVRGYDPNAVSQLVVRKKKERKKKERIVYLAPEESIKEPIEEPSVQEDGTPIVYNFIYPGASAQCVAPEEYVTIEHPIRNRILAGIGMLLSLLFIVFSIFGTVYIGTGGSAISGYTGFDIIGSVISSMFGANQNGWNYYSVFNQELNNGWFFLGYGINQRMFAGLLLTGVLTAAVAVAVADLIRCAVKLATGKAKGTLQVLPLLVVIATGVLFYAIRIHNTLAFYPEGVSAFWGYQATATATIDGVTVTDVVFVMGLAFILSFVAMVARLVMGFFFKKDERMTKRAYEEKYGKKAEDTDSPHPNYCYAATDAAQPTMCAQTMGAPEQNGQPIPPAQPVPMYYGQTQTVYGMADEGTAKTIANGNMTVDK